MSPRDVRTLILEAWSDAPYPGDDAIAYDQSGRHLECALVAGFFRGKRWKDVTLAALRSYRGDASACLAFMSPQAFRYYLPAYMLIAIDDYAEADVIADSALNMLTPGELQEYWNERAKGFSQRQREAILSFLNCLDRHHGADYLSMGRKMRSDIGRMQFNPPVNADARVSVVPSRGRRARAGYWERWATEHCKV